MDKDIRYLKGVGEARAASFAKMNIKTVEDLLYLFPRSYEDRTKTKAIADIISGETVCVSVTVFSPVRELRIRKNMTLYSMIVTDSDDTMTVVWYNNKYVKNVFSPGEKYILFGKASLNRGRMEMLNPVYEKEGKGKYTGKIIPVYPLTAGLVQKNVQSVMELALEAAGKIDEYLPAYLREKYQIAEINDAMKNIHFPETFESYQTARRRFIFEELFILQLALSSKKEYLSVEAGAVMENVTCVKTFLKTLPFSPTNAQLRTIKEILKDLSGGLQMNRLVQGDVGSGKTVVAAAAMYVAVQNGYQAVLMAPTEILASQHYETLRSLFKNTGINITLLTGAMTAKEKRIVNDEITMGIAEIIIGTHALIQPNVTYRNLGLVIADEQHRFGVEQRAKLCAKGDRPHMLIMSATPIPRTLALILYGDLSISLIDELPPGRKMVKTYAVGESMRQRVYAFLEKNIRAGMQSYVVCPLIEETKDSDLKNTEDLAEKLQQIFPKFKVGLIHGKMKPRYKDQVMEEFARGNINILVSTTVIEVGVNVPNSNIMIIENAERFGLSQLHQLRGRVGRGADQAYCILFAHGNNEVTKKRMETMCMSNDGFYISEQDLKLRGPGDFFGTRQHGLPEMKIANLFEDQDILKQAQEAASYVLRTDRKLEKQEHEKIRRRIEKVYEAGAVL